MHSGGVSRARVTLYRAGSSQQSQTGLAQLGLETRSRSELGSAQAQTNLEFPSWAMLGLGISEIYELSSVWAQGK